MRRAERRRRQDAMDRAGTRNGFSGRSTRGQCSVPRPDAERGDGRRNPLRLPIEQFPGVKHIAAPGGSRGDEVSKRSRDASIKLITAVPSPDIVAALMFGSGVTRAGTIRRFSARPRNMPVPATQGAYVTYNQTTPAVTNQRRAVRIPTHA